MPWIIAGLPPGSPSITTASMRPRRYAVDNRMNALASHHQQQQASMRPRRYAPWIIFPFLSASTAFKFASMRPRRYAVDNPGIQG